MDTTVAVILIAIIAVIAIGFIVVAVKKQRTGRLRDRFGPEYDRAVEQEGGRRKAEGELADRESRREELDIRPLSAASHERYAAAWKETQARFVDAPETAATEAETLVNQVMRERGYPVDDDLERRAADVSVDHPDVVDNYRGARRITQRSGDGDSRTEALRQALVHYRSLFDELLEAGHDDRPHDDRAVADSPARDDGVLESGPESERARPR